MPRSVTAQRETDLLRPGLLPRGARDELLQVKPLTLRHVGSAITGHFSQR